jgi:1,4-alpha-glucan branching enzyme
VFNSDQDIYGGSNRINPKVLKSSEETWSRYNNVIYLTIPPLGITILKAKKKRKPRTPKKVEA